MECREYIAQLLSAHADGELLEAERALAQQHLDACPACRARLEQEKGLKRSLRASLIATAPESLRTAVETRLKREPVGRPARRVLRGRVWLPIAIAALVVIAILLRGWMQPSERPAFDEVARRYSEFAKEFAPNVPSRSPATIAVYYRSNGLPVRLWDLSPAGYTLEGGRLEKLGDGRTVAYTLYRGPKGYIMCAFYRGHRVAPPPGGVMWGANHWLYSYRNFAVNLTLDGNIVCILIAKMPMAEFKQVVGATEHSGH